MKPRSSNIAGSGRRDFLRQQLTGNAALPTAVQRRIDEFEVSHRAGAELLLEAGTAQKQLSQIPRARHAKPRARPSTTTPARC